MATVTNHPDDVRNEEYSSVLRTVILPEFTPEQIAYLDERMAAARFRSNDDRLRIGGV